MQKMNSKNANFTSDKCINNMSELETLNIETIQSSEEVETNSSKSTNCIKSFIFKPKSIEPKKKLPKCQLSRGLMTAIIFVIFFCFLVIWFVNDFEDDSGLARNSTNQTTPVYDYIIIESALPIQYVLLATFCIVSLIILTVFISAITHHLRQQDESCNIDTIASKKLFKAIFSSHRSQDRTTLYYLNQDFTAELKKDNIKMAGWDDICEDEISKKRLSKSFIKSSKKDSLS